MWGERGRRVDRGGIMMLLGEMCQERGAIDLQEGVALVRDAVGHGSDHLCKRGVGKRV